MTQRKEVGDLAHFCLGQCGCAAAKTPVKAAILGILALGRALGNVRGALEPAGLAQGGTILR